MVNASGEILRALFVLFASIGFLGLTTTAVRAWIQDDWRLALLVATTLCGVQVWLATEALSALGHLTLTGAIILWCMSCFGILVIIGQTRGRSENIAQRFSQTTISPSLLLPLVCSVTIISVLLCIALIAAPSNWDSMTYHLSRAMHWRQNQGIDFYSTPILRQLYFGPFAEMAITHLYLLAGNDRLVNFVQWLAMVGSTIAVSYIAKILGGSIQAQLLSAVISLSIPMGILQSTSTQNDYVTAFWVAAFTAFSLKIISEGPSGGYALLTGASLGLAILTKATAYVFATPIALWLGIDLLGKFRTRGVKFGSLILAAALLINSGHFLRNWRLFDNPLGPMVEGPTKRTYTNEIYTTASFASNVMRNSAIHSGFPLHRFNVAVGDWVVAVHRYIGLDVNDPRTTWSRAKFQLLFVPHEDFAGNPLHLALFCASILFLFRNANHRTILFAGCVSAGFLLFCLLLKWQPYHSRLHLPFFVLASACSAVVLQRVLERRLVFLLIFALTISSFLYISYNHSRPLLGSNSIVLQNRDDQYWNNRKQLANPYRKAAELIRSNGCTQIGMIIGNNDWEYPLWLLTGAARGDAVLRHIQVENVSGKITTNTFTPCAVITTQRRSDRYISYKNIFYQEILDDPAPVKLYMATKDSHR